MSLSFRVICPHCGEPTRAPVESFYRWWPNETVGPAEQSASLALAAGGSYCPECEGLIALLVSGTDKVLRPILAQDVDESDWGHFQADLELKEYFPKPRALRFSEAVPAEIRDVLPDLLEDVNRRRNAVSSLALCRSILEVAVKDLEAKHGISPSRKLGIMGRIDGLRAAGVITEPLAEWAHELRLDGNESVHELKGDPSLAKAYSGFLVQLLDVAFELPRRIKALKAAKEKAKRPVGRS